MPLADLLTPMIARKSIELQRQLPPAQGYLQAQQSMGANPGQITQPVNPAYPGGPSVEEQNRLDTAYKKRLEAQKKADARRLADAPSFDPRLQDPKVLQGIDALKRAQSPDPKVRMQGRKDLQTLDMGPIMPMPNPGAPSGPPVAFDEAGRSIYAAPQPPMPLAGRHQNQILLPQGQPVGIDERTGQAIDARGKKMGYLDQEAMNPGMRYLDMRPGDLSLDTPKEQIMRDPFARAQMDQMYGKHLHTKDDNEGKFPTGYLESLKHKDGTPYTKQERKNIEQGVKVLREIQDRESAQMGPLT